MTVDLGPLAVERGGSVLLDHAVRAAPAGTRIVVEGTQPDLRDQARTWCRLKGLAWDGEAVLAAPDPRWAGAVPSGPEVAAVADPRWGLATRGALVEDGAAELLFPLSDRDAVWDDDVPRLYAAAAAAQWDPATAIPWGAPIDHGEAVERAVAQVMTYLVENEIAALLVPAGFLGQIHPHYREVVGFLATQAADEARHAEVPLAFAW